MMYEEFTARLPEGTKLPTAEQYEIIEEVYSTHPLFDEATGIKDKIAELYSKYGMRIICDMRETAKRAGEIKDDIQKKRREIEELKHEYKELSMR
ncbi:MAG: hypothetical protein NC120_11990 [Ruminococcus sp.]|nr:hypothetical protein [Ruminococcus sp.]